MYEKLKQEARLCIADILVAGVLHKTDPNIGTTNIETLDPDQIQAIAKLFVAVADNLADDPDIKIKAQALSNTDANSINDFVATVKSKLHCDAEAEELCKMFDKFMLPEFREELMQTIRNPQEKIDPETIAMEINKFSNFLEMRVNQVEEANKQRQHIKDTLRQNREKHTPLFVNLVKIFADNKTPPTTGVIS